MTVTSHRLEHRSGDSFGLSGIPLSGVRRRIVVVGRLGTDETSIDLGFLPNREDACPTARFLPEIQNSSVRTRARSPVSEARVRRDRFSHMRWGLGVLLARAAWSCWSSRDRVGTAENSDCSEGVTNREVGCAIHQWSPAEFGTVLSSGDVDA